MSLRSAVLSLSRKVGLVTGATETCPTCGLIASAGTRDSAADGPTHGARNVPQCTQCRIPIDSPGVIVRRYARGYRVATKVIDLR